MQRKLTITVDADVYVGGDLAAGYAAMAADEAREAQAQAWSEALIEDVARWAEPA